MRKQGIPPAEQRGEHLNALREIQQVLDGSPGEFPGGAEGMLAAIETIIKRELEKEAP